MSEAQTGSKPESTAETRGDGKAPPAGGAEWLKNLPALIAAIAALVTSVAALRKPPDTSAAKASYDELSKVIEKVEGSSDQNHQDIIALRNFLEGYLRAQGKLVADAPVLPRAPQLAKRPDHGKAGTGAGSGEGGSKVGAGAAGPQRPEEAAKPTAAATPQPPPEARPQVIDPDTGTILIPRFEKRPPLPAPRGFQQMIKDFKADVAAKDK